jgi:hypothetical protein
MPFIRSSRTAVAASGLPLQRGSSAVGRGRAGLLHLIRPNTFNLLRNLNMTEHDIKTEYVLYTLDLTAWVILNMYFLRREVVSTSPNPQSGGPPFVGCPRLLIQFIYSYSPYRRALVGTVRNFPVP